MNERVGGAVRGLEGINKVYSDKKKLGKPICHTLHPGVGSSLEQDIVGKLN